MWYCVFLGTVPANSSMGLIMAAEPVARARWQQQVWNHCRSAQFLCFAISLMLLYIDELVMEDELLQYPSSQCMVKWEIGCFFFDSFWTWWGIRTFTGCDKFAREIKATWVLRYFLEMTGALCKYIQQLQSCWLALTAVYLMASSELLVNRLSYWSSYLGA